MPNEWKTIKSLVHKIRLHGWRGKGMAESLLARKSKARTAERRWMRNPVWPYSCVTPAGTSNGLDVQNEWEENTQHTHYYWGTRLNNAEEFFFVFAAYDPT